MGSFTKVALKISCFLVIFAVIFSITQDILKYKWDKHEFLSEKYEWYEQEPEGTIDVLFFGTSLVYAGITPMVIWEEQGITAINFGMSLDTAMLDYYRLRYALEYQTPKVVVLDMSAFFEERTADNEQFEAPYRKLVEALPDKKLKMELIQEIVSTNENQDYLSYLFPLLRYHERWNEIAENEFEHIYWYQDYFKGALLNYVSVPVYTYPGVSQMLEDNGLGYLISGITIESQEELSSEPNQNSVSYYEKIVELCAEKDIKVLVITMPRFDGRYSEERAEALSEWCEMNGVEHIDYLKDDLYETLAIDWRTDYYDNEHMSIWGSVKLSKDIAARMAEIYSLENHKGQAGYEKWDENWKLFSERYSEVLEKAENDRTMLAEIQ